jgi:SAM-dependent methyltransferase
MSAVIDQIDAKHLQAEDFTKLAYLSILKRKVDPSGLAHWQQIINEGKFTHKMLISALTHSPEFAQLERPFWRIQHEARLHWVGKLELFERVFDIGGSSPNIPEGALIELGYRHRPKEIVVFDLPEEQQYWGKPKFPQDREYAFDWGKLWYAHGRVESIKEHTGLDDLRFDLVFMGQTFEHIYREKMPDVLSWVRDHLTPTGKFIFDTPNRLVTKLHFPDQFIDEDHKHEYTPTEAIELLASCGLKVVKSTALVSMPESLREGRFIQTEADGCYGDALHAPNADTGYLFAMEAMRA